MPRPLKPFVRGGGYYPSRRWTPLVYNGGYTTMNGGKSPEPPVPPPEYWKTVTGISPISLVNSLAKPLQSLTRYGRCEQRNPTPPPLLPDGYTELKTVRNANYSNDTAYVETGVTLTSIFNTRLSVKNLRLTGDSNYSIAAGGNTSDFSSIYGLFALTNDRDLWYGIGDQPLLASFAFDDAYHDVVLEIDGSGNVSISVDGTPVEIPATTAVDITGKSLPITLVGEPVNWFAWPGDIGRVTLEQNGVTLFDCVPAERDSDDVVGFYDVTASAFRVQTDGDPITAGDPVPAPVPADPTPDASVDIWCNNGVLRANVNILDPANVYGNYLLKDNGKVGNAAENFYLTNFILVRPSTSYTFTFRSGADAQYRRLAEYTSDDEDTFIKLTIKMPRPTAVDDVITRTFVTSPTTNYIRLSSSVLDTEQSILLTDYALNEVFAFGTPEDGVISADGVADQHFSVADLLGVGAYSNVQGIIDGIKSGEVAAYALTGDEAWMKSGNVFAGSSILPDKMRGKSQMLCTHFVYSSEASTGIASGQFGCASTSTNTYFRYSAISTLDDWKAFLKRELAAGTPVIVVYRLAESITKQLTPQPLTTARGTTTITSSSPVEARMRVEYASSEE